MPEIRIIYLSPSYSISKRCMVNVGLVIIQVHNLELAFVLQI